VTIKQVIECGTVNKFENGVDTESTNNEVCRQGFNLMSPERMKKARRRGLWSQECAGQRTAER